MFANDNFALQTIVGYNQQKTKRDEVHFDSQTKLMTMCERNSKSIFTDLFMIRMHFDGVIYQVSIRSFAKKIKILHFLLSVQCNSLNE